MTEKESFPEIIDSEGFFFGHTWTKIWQEPARMKKNKKNTSFFSMRCVHLISTGAPDFVHTTTTRAQACVISKAAQRSSHPRIDWRRWQNIGNQIGEPRPHLLRGSMAEKSHPMNESTAIHWKNQRIRPKFQRSFEKKNVSGSSFFDGKKSLWEFLDFFLRHYTYIFFSSIFSRKWNQLDPAVVFSVGLCSQWLCWPKSLDVQTWTQWSHHRFGSPHWSEPTKRWAIQL